MVVQLSRTVFENVRIFTGRETLSEPSDVEVTGSLITRIAPHHSAVDDAAPADADVLRIDGAGATLMPGLIDAHWHTMFAVIGTAELLTADVGYVNILAANAARDTLLRGFTSVRDAGGPAFGVKRAIDAGLIQGPRIYPSGAMISQTGGHGDFRMPYEVPRGIVSHLSRGERLGGAIIADGDAEVLRAAREQLMLGASQVKVMAGGGVASPYDPLDVTQYGESELHAAVEAAENWGTYVMVHAYTPHATQRAIRAGVKSIEHGQLLDDRTAEMMVEKNVWWSLQPFLDDEDAIPIAGPNRAKQEEVVNGTDVAYGLAKKHGVKTAWGSDTLFDARLATRQGAQLAKLTRWYSPLEVLRMATETNAELLALSGERNPYPGRLGVVQEGALADVLLVDGNPVDDIQLLATPETSLRVIMKAGVVVKK